MEKDREGIGMKPPGDARLRWVLADPAGERAVDALGTSVQADRLADLLVPQLSVSTRRARYFSFLCWAVQRSHASEHPTTSIHRLEAELALEEARPRRDGSRHDCSDVIGRLNASRYLVDHDWKDPARPERLYRNPAFMLYRPAMRSLGMLGRSRRPELTPEGHQLAAAFAKARGRKPRCLSDISAKEQRLLKTLLGLDYRKRDPTAPSARRRSTFEAIHGPLESGANAWEILERHAKWERRASQVARTLHRAYVWELISLGLALAFSMLLVEQRTTSVSRKLRHSLAGRPRCPKLREFNGGDDIAPNEVVGLLRAALRLRPERLGLDQQPIDLAKVLVDGQAPGRFLERLVHRHERVKPDGPWMTLTGEVVRILAPAKALALRTRPRTYRLDAYHQILRDLEMVSP